MRILIATNGSVRSEMALRFSKQLTRRAGKPPTVLTVVQRDADRPQADAILARAQELLKPDVPVIFPKVRIGGATDEIVREAGEGNYDLVIVGESRNRSPVARLLSGSTAIRIAEKAPCSVVVAKGKAGLVRRILLCDSGAEFPSALGRFTAQLANQLEAEEEVTVLHVMSQISAGPGVHGQQLRAGVGELITEHTPEGKLLKADMEILEQPGIIPRPKVRRGLVIDEILAEAKAGDYDLVVIGAHRDEGWQRFLLDDLARKIVVRLDRPVLVLR